MSPAARPVAVKLVAETGCQAPLSTLTSHWVLPSAAVQLRLTASDSMLSNTRSVGAVQVRGAKVTLSTTAGVVAVPTRPLFQ